MTGTIAIDRDYAAALFEQLRLATADPPGVTRAAFGAGEECAHQIVRGEGRALGLTEAVDAAGNLYLTYEGRDPSLPGWIIGSHLDSVPHGGNFDGAAGVIAGLSAVRALSEAGCRPRHPVTVMAIRAEESNWFPVSYLGSKAAFGLLPPASLDVRRSDSGRTLREHLVDLGLRPDDLTPDKAYLRPERIRGFVEVHIEQGPVLEAADLPVGLVTGISGSVRYRKARCLGAWGHSGAVPRQHRQDAVFALSELVVSMDRHWKEIVASGQHATITFGEVGTNATLHGFSTVPGEVAFSFDARSQSTECLEDIHGRLMHEVERISSARGVRFALGDRTGSTPARLDEALLASLLLVAERRGVGCKRIASGAGHDAAVFAAAGVPTAMLFVRNQNGSHNPLEEMQIADFGLAVDVLTDFLSDDDLSG